MSQFELSIGTILKHEGGYVNDPSDPGGATNYGVSIRFLVNAGDMDGDGYLDGDIDKDGDIDVEDIKKMTMLDAMRIYELHFWTKYKIGTIVDQRIATKFFDMTVNMGFKQASLILQRALHAVGNPVLLDGAAGPKTYGAVNDSIPSSLHAALCSEQASFYRVLISQKPNLAKFERGWLRRAYETNYSY